MFGKIMTFVVISVGIYALISVSLIMSVRLRPFSVAQTEASLDFSQTVARGAVKIPQTVTDVASDGTKLTSFFQTGPEGAPLLVLVHGSGWYGAQFHGAMPNLAQHADVLAVNLRGHYLGAGTRGDVSYIGQLEDDVADIIKAHVKPGQKVVLGGHSSGGGLVVRFAGGAHKNIIDGAVLLAPFLKYNAPTTRENSGGWARVLTRRIIGLSMLNMVKIHLLDGLPVIQFAMPKSVIDGPNGQAATLSYSWRLNTSFAPRSAYLKDISTLPTFLLIAGREDESFVAEGYQPLMSDVTDKGQYHVLEDVTHLEVVDAPQTAVLVGVFLDDFR